MLFSLYIIQHLTETLSIDVKQLDWGSIYALVKILIVVLRICFGCEMPFGDHRVMSFGNYLRLSSENNSTFYYVLKEVT